MKYSPDSTAASPNRNQPKITTNQQTNIFFEKIKINKIIHSIFKFFFLVTAHEVLQGLEVEPGPLPPQHLVGPWVLVPLGGGPYRVRSRETRLVMVVVGGRSETQQNEGRGGERKGEDL